MISLIPIYILIIVIQRISIEYRYLRAVEKNSTTVPVLACVNGAICVITLLELSIHKYAEKSQVFIC